MPIPLQQVVNVKNAAEFGKKWTHRGVAVFMDEVHYAFAADFANVVCTSLIEQQMARAAAAAKPKVILAEE